VVVMRPFEKRNRKLLFWKKGYESILAGLSQSDEHANMDIAGVIRSTTTDNLLALQNELDDMKETLYRERSRASAEAFMENPDSYSLSSPDGWLCHISSIGVCVYDIDDMNGGEDCKFCGAPEERK
jgi:hypothetical protein